MKRLIQATLLAIVVVPLGSIALEADTMYFNCSYYSEFGCSEGEGTSATWDFGDYYLYLQFDLNSGANFSVDVTPTVISPGAFLEKAGLFPGYTCLAVTAAGECVEFAVTPSEGQVGNWTHYTIEIGWAKIDGQDLDGSRMTLLHDRTALPNFGTEDYDWDVCLTALYDPCFIDPDPLIRSGDTDFETFIAAYRPAVSVPEPSSLVLLGAGLGAVLLRRRRQYL